jgi:NOL1/NOP2/fmu family ribosome biogenesis protein
MSKVVEKVVENQQATDKLWTTVESLKARVVELEARLDQLNENDNGLHFVEICDKLICMRGNIPVMIAAKEDREAVMVLCELSDPKTIRACKQGKELMEKLRANSAK